MKVHAMTLAGAAVLLLAGAAHAQPTRTTLVHVEGADAEAVRRDVIAALGDGTSVVASADEARAWRASAARGRAGARRDAARLGRAARAAHADAAVLVTVGATTRVIALDTGGTSIDVAMRTHDGAALARTLAPLATHDAPSAPPPAAASASTERAEPAPSDPAPSAPALAAVDATGEPPRDTGARDASSAPTAHDPAHATLNVQAGVQIAMRDFHYDDIRTPALRDYHLGAAPLATLEGEAYPFAATGRPFLRDLGMVGAYARAFALASSSVDAGTVGTSWSRFAVGARYRARPFGDDGPLLRASLSYGGETFALAGADVTGTIALPSVDYRMIRPGLDARVPLGRFAVHGGVGYAAVLTGGPVASRFAGASVGGVDAQVGASMTVMTGLELRADVDYRRYFYALTPAPQATYVAGGALDQYAGATLALAFLR